MNRRGRSGKRLCLLTAVLGVLTLPHGVRADDDDDDAGAARARMQPAGVQGTKAPGTKRPEDPP